MHALGVGVPQMAEIADGLNEKLGTAFRFTRLDDARRILEEDLRRRSGQLEG
jgi:hypothetical protein